VRETVRETVREEAQSRHTCRAPQMLTRSRSLPTVLSPSMRYTLENSATVSHSCNSAPLPNECN
jgi:hypothetical protein